MRGKIMFEELKEKVLKFDNDRQVYLMILIPRSKDNKIVQSQETMHTHVRTIKKLDDFDNCFIELDMIGESLNLRYNIYLTVNPRDTIKAYHAMKKKFVEWDYHLINGDQDSIRAIKKLDREWQTCLQLETSKSQCNYFLIDIDSKEINCINNIKNILKSITQNKIEYENETRNGYHLLVKPFDSREFIEYVCAQKYPVELLKDRLIQIYHNEVVYE